VTHNAQRLEVGGIVEARGVSFVLDDVVRDGGETIASYAERVLCEVSNPHALPP
jgi:hypothetical protein